MDFSNLFFLYIFLPLSLAAYFLAPGIKAKNVVLLVCSLLFALLGQWQALPLLLLTTVVNYFLGAKATERWGLIAALVWNVGFLAFFKLGLGGIFPLGISFYTFALVSYQVDVYRGDCAPSSSFWEFLLYVSFFPKLLMGPVVPYRRLEKQLRHRHSDSRSILEGAVRFTVGLAKKVLIADYAYGVYEQLSKQSYGASAWAAALLYFFYIYFEFSGCADMAIGLGRVFGFRLLENFNLPYGAGSVTEFWRRWHMTLGSFFRDYVYIPLGGSRKGRGRQFLNLLIVWLLTGLWHGQSWPFVLWGLYYFVLLCGEKLLHWEKKTSVFRLILTQLLVMLGWVIFSSESLPVLWQRLAQMFASTEFWGAPLWTVLQNSLPLLILCFVGASILPRGLAFLWSCLPAEGKSVRHVFFGVGLFLFVVLLLVLCTASMLGAAAKPSLYSFF